MLVRIGLGVLSCVVSFAIAYYATMPSSPPASPSPSPSPSSAPPVGEPAEAAAHEPMPPSRADSGRRVEAAPASPSASTRPAPSSEDARALQLRNRVTDEIGRDQQRRGVSVMDCLADVELAGDQKLRFAVRVTSQPAEALVEGWRFVEIVDGQALPEPFAACASAVVRPGLRVVGDPHAPFPAFEGELDILYRVPSP